MKSNPVDYDTYSRDYGDHKDHMHAFLDKEAEELRSTVEVR